MHRTLRFLVPGLLLTGLMAAPAAARVGVYVTSSGNATADTAVVNLLTSLGHTPTLGVEFTAFDGTQSLAGISTVYLQVNYNWATGNMPAAGQTALVNFVNGGGGLVTTEWLVWNTAFSGLFATLEPLLPVVPTSVFDTLVSGTFTRTTPNATLNAGLPNTFTTPLENISGTQTHFTTLRPGATEFYDNNGFIGVAGIASGAGRILTFNTVNAQEQVADPNFGRLLGNSMNWAAGVTITAVGPEPGALALLLPALLGVAAYRRRSRTSCPS